MYGKDAKYIDVNNKINIPNCMNCAWLIYPLNLDCWKKKYQQTTKVKIFIKTKKINQNDLYFFASPGLKTFLESL